MIAYTCVPSPRHQLADHPENAGRFPLLERAVEELPGAEKEAIIASPAPYERVAAVHSPAYLEALSEACQHGPAIIDYAPTYVTPESYNAAFAAAGGALTVLERVLSQPGTTGFALVRPPGHHALAERAMGFCLLNNIAIAAFAALDSGMQRVMIVDFDVHHGNGTQALTEADPRLLYISTHQEGIYPGTGYEAESGIGPGEGTVINMPLPAGTGDQGFRQAWEAVICPAGERFNPELILVSAGFDSHWRDPLANFQLTETGFARLATDLLGLSRLTAQGRLLFVLEGGYDPPALAGSVRACFQALSRLPATWEEAPRLRDEPAIEARLKRIAGRHGL
jgi:acetoin utilization deacetylase AcuC-like enzyme